MKSPPRSRYDELHEELEAIPTTKAGVRYERLAALTLQLLRKRATVIHDLKLVGGSSVRHQIDVTIDHEGAKRRVLVECKDFDISGNKVGLDIVRNFFGAVEDVRPDEAIVMTCTGFTKDARTYAEAKGIKLAVLRIFEDADWEGRIKKIVLNINAIQSPRITASDIRFDSAVYEDFVSDLSDLGVEFLTSDADVYLVNGAKRQQFAELIHAKADEEKLSSGSKVSNVEFSTDEWALQVGDQPLRRFVKAEFTVEMPDPSVSQIVVEDDRLATLIVEGLGSNSHVIFEDDLTQLTLSKIGQVVAKI